MGVVPMEFAMRYRRLLLITGWVCTSAAAQTVAPPASLAGDRWSVPAPPASSHEAYRDALSTAAGDAQRFNFSGQAPKDKAPLDQTPIRVIINNGRGANVNCIPMGVAGACH